MQITICMNASRFQNLDAIFSLDLESQYMFSSPVAAVVVGVLVVVGICFAKKRYRSVPMSDP